MGEGDVRESERSVTTPSSTYRLQLSPAFTFDDAVAVVPYLHELGVTHAYLSPILQAAPGSVHGYDVVDHSRINAELGGEQGLLRLAGALHERAMGAVADIVPNHMGMPVPESRNHALWSVLRDGPDSRYASWFDIDWTAQGGSMLLPVLGRRIGECVRDGELYIDAGTDAGTDTSEQAPVLRYFDHVFPLRPGTESLPLPQLLRAQHYRVAHWRVAAEEPGYRRFFDISTLIALRVEDPAVFDATHRLLLDLLERGVLDGLRVDHVDGLADPRGYLRRLDAAARGKWIVAEKILAPEETMPDDWPCAGSTGYDAMRAVTALLTDPSGAARLTALHSGLTGGGLGTGLVGTSLINTAPTGASAEFGAVVAQAKLDVLDHVLHAELDRLTDLLGAICRTDLDLIDHTHTALRDAVRMLLAALPVYRAYTVPGEPPPPDSVRLLEVAVSQASMMLPEPRHDTLAIVRDLALGRIGPRDRLRDEFQVRFQQVSGAVAAKGVEDTATYRWNALPMAGDVGGDPASPALSPTGFHLFCALLQARWPNGMTTLSTHDAKRSEDVRARLAVLAELPEEWAAAVAGWQARADELARVRALADGPAAEDQWADPEVKYLLWLTLVGCWPIDEDRLLPYLTKAVREAKAFTSWTAPAPAYEAAVLGFAKLVLADEDLRASVHRFAGHIERHAAVNRLAQKLLQLTMTGVPDVYQGSEVEFRALVDPDNRRPVDFAALAERLARIDREQAAGEALAPQDEKPLLVSRTLRLRRAHPGWFDARADQTPLFPAGPAAEHAVAFLRGDHVAVVATRLPAGLARRGGWQGTSLALPPGTWRCELTGRVFEPHTAISDSVPLEELTRTLPVALLVRQDGRISQPSDTQ
ncbi:MAG TPA: malto-oligosyltrehalose synthase [Actinocrinis sp.]|uniref:malto-oligosyltrehalose synthase n=1 Tax=Actinocrinis sp. TaxID=1920516 RepID=UPI002DDCFC6A|nr:malto-oligosyltrehalose synthase [Actinocrinis sp.]HEV2342949.1 malto-oligosyltrehalose synthase [Actinocrinis sp.]